MPTKPYDLKCSAVFVVEKVAKSLTHAVLPNIAEGLSRLCGFPGEMGGEEEINY